MTLEPSDCAMRLRSFELVVYIDHDGREQIDWQYGPVNPSRAWQLLGTSTLPC